jgi:hypothetical protein
VQQLKQKVTNRNHKNTMAERLKNIKKRGLQAVAAAGVAVSLYGGVEAGKGNWALRKIKPKLIALQAANEKQGLATDQLIARTDKDEVLSGVRYRGGLVEQDPNGAVESLSEANRQFLRAGQEIYASRVLEIMAEIIREPHPEKTQYEAQRQRLIEAGRELRATIDVVSQKKSEKEALVEKGKDIAGAPLKAGAAGFVLIRGGKWGIGRLRSRNQKGTLEGAGEDAPITQPVV